MLEAKLDMIDSWDVVSGIEGKADRDSSLPVSSSKQS